MIASGWATSGRRQDSRSMPDWRLRLGAGRNVSRSETCWQSPPKRDARRYQIIAVSTNSGRLKVAGCGEYPQTLWFTQASFAARELPVEFEVQLQNVHPRLSQESQLPAFGGRGHYPAQFFFIDSTSLRYARQLEGRGGGRDVVVQSGSRG